MDLEMVLNDLSIQSPANSIPQARRLMEELIDTVVLATSPSHGVKRTIRTDSGLDHLLLAPDYTIAQWRNDSAVRREMRSFFRTLTAHAPFLDGVLNQELVDKNNMCQFFHEGREAKGLGAAYLLDALALSLRSEPFWEESQINLSIVEMDEEGIIHEDQRISVMHASMATHVETHAAWIVERIQADQKVSKGQNIWHNREEWFPRLQFCDVVEAQLQILSSGHPLLHAILKKLRELDGFCLQWHDGAFDTSTMPFKVSPESSTTLEQYWSERTFRCPDGEERLFSWHVRLTPNSWRIHFIPDDSTKRLIIGYIGRHLPTARYN